MLHTKVCLQLMLQLTLEGENRAHLRVLRGKSWTVRVCWAGGTHVGNTELDLG